jgi:hypothetical protein
LIIIRNSSLGSFNFSWKVLNVEILRWYVTLNIWHYAMSHIYIAVCCVLPYYYYYWPPLWSSGQSSWLQIQRPGFDSQLYQIFWEVVGLKWGPLSLVSTIEEFTERYV